MDLLIFKCSTKYTKMCNSKLKMLVLSLCLNFTVISGWQDNLKNTQLPGTMVPVFNLSTWEEETDRISRSSRPAFSICSEFQTSESYIVRTCLKNKTEQNQRPMLPQHTVRPGFYPWPQTKTKHRSGWSISEETSMTTECRQPRWNPGKWLCACGGKRWLGGVAGLRWRKLGKTRRQCD